MHIKKKLMALLVASVMMFTMVGCSDSKEAEETSFDIEHAVIGTWVCDYEVSASQAHGYYYGVGDEITITMELYRGGTGSIEWYNNSLGEPAGGYNLTWEVEDVDLINIDYSFMGAGKHYGVEYDEDEDILSYVDGSHTFTREGGGGGAFGK